MPPLEVALPLNALQERLVRFAETDTCSFGDGATMMTTLIDSVPNPTKAGVVGIAVAPSEADNLKHEYKNRIGFLQTVNSGMGLMKTEQTHVDLNDENLNDLLDMICVKDVTEFGLALDPSVWATFKDAVMQRV